MMYSSLMTTRTRAILGWTPAILVALFMVVAKM